jgi:murein DD-endopeptidase MepM/ murein hydrolase activator NlpD
MPVTYTVHAGDSLGDIAQRFGSSVQQLAHINGLDDPYVIYPGQTLGVSNSPSTPIPSAQDIANVDWNVPVNPPLRGDPKARSRTVYDSVINQFAVEVNPRYAPRHNDHYCSVFVWDVTRAMNAVIPRLVGGNDEPLEPWLTDEGWTLSDPCRWMSAHDAHQWLGQCGSQYGWREVSAKEAQELASMGHPAVASMASMHEHHEPGHMGIVRPGKALNGPALAQAGFLRVNHAHVYDIFPREGTQFFVNDAGTVVEPGPPPTGHEPQHLLGSYTVRPKGNMLGEIARRVSKLWKP